MFTRSYAALMIGTLLTVVGQMDAAVIKALSVSFTDVSAAIGLAQEGDTVMVPAGSASWTSTLTVTKGITLQGASTVTGAGTQNVSVNDATNITNNTGGSGLINIQLTPSQHFHLTGLTFTKGTSNGVVVNISGNGPGPHMDIRIDHNHFNNFNGSEAVSVGGWVYGVADHNYLHTTTNTPCFFIGDFGYGGQQLGHGAWADYPWFGTNKFFFIEDNTMKGDGSEPTSGNIDSQFGGRLVVRHNDFTNCRVGWHGTEGAYRGMRAIEVYNNASHWTITPMGDNRSGTALFHDNTWDGVQSDNNSHGRIEIFREWAGVGSDCPYAYADGTGPFDSNDTEGNGTYVRGHAPHLFDSGKVTNFSTANSNGNAYGTIVDTSKSWTPNQWVGYNIKQANPAAASFPKGSFITSNTATTITYLYYNTNDRGPVLVFAAGDTYQIHKLLVPLDQVGRGKGDLLTGTGPIINSATGGTGWPQQALEPAMSWNNTDSGGNAYGFYTQIPSEVQGRDFYNLGKGLPTNGAPSQVTNIYTAATNGVDYTGPYTYPHPLTNPPAPPADLTIVP